MSKIDTCPCIKKLLKKWAHRGIPTSETLKRRYLPETYHRSIDSIRKKLGNDYFWVSLDETTDTSKRSIGIFVIGSLQNPKIGSYVLNYAELKTTSSLNIQKFFNDSLEILFGNGKFSICTAYVYYNILISEFHSSISFHR